MANNYWINGRALEDSQKRWMVMEGTKIPSIGSVRSSSVSIPNRSGVLQTPPRGSDPMQVAINVMVTDLGGRGGWHQLQLNWDALMAICRPFNKMSEIQWRPDGMGIRTAKCRLAGGVEPVFDRGAMTYDATLIFEIPSGCWQDVTAPEMAVSDMSKIRGGSAPITNPLFIVQNPGVVVAVQDYMSGRRLAWAGSPKAGKMLLLDPDNWRASWLDAKQWTHTTDDASFGLDMGAFGFALHPDYAGVYTAQASGGQWTVKAARSYA